MEGNHLVRKEKALIGNFHNPAVGRKETCYFCYKHCAQAISEFNNED
jgi:hypothetical protein